MEHATKKRRIHKPDPVEEAESEAQLESLLFGKATKPAKPSKKKKIIQKPLESPPVSEQEDNHDNDSAVVADTDLFVIDTVGSGITPEEDIDDVDSGEDDSEEEDRQVKSQIGAWADSDDEQVVVSLKDKGRLRKLRIQETDDRISGNEYEQRLRRQFERTNPVLSWAIAQPDDKIEDDEVDTLLKSSTSILGIDRTVLSAGRIEIQRLKNANQASQSKSAIKVVEFHPTAPVLLTAGLDKSVRLFQIDGKVNPLLQAWQLDMPIMQAGFHPHGNSLMLSGRSKRLYIFDLQQGKMSYKPGILTKEKDSASVDYHRSLEKFKMSPCGRYVAFLGRDGHISVCSWGTMHIICSFKMNGSVDDMTWSQDGNQLSTVGKEGEVYEWDIGSRRCINRWKDDGGFNLLSIASVISSREGRRYVATGAQAGVVNIYDADHLKPSEGLDSTMNTPTPLKTLMNITTPIDKLAFNHDGQILAMSSKEVKDAFRLVHVPSLTVFSNWPTANTPLANVSSVAFSPGSHHMAVGNEKGRVLLYRLAHYV